MILSFISDMYRTNLDISINYRHSQHRHFYLFCHLLLLGYRYSDILWFVKKFSTKNWICYERRHPVCMFASVYNHKFLQPCRDITQSSRLWHWMKMKCLKLKMKLFQMRKAWLGTGFLNNVFISSFVDYAFSFCVSFFISNHFVPCGFCLLMVGQELLKHWKSSSFLYMERTTMRRMTWQLMKRETQPPEKGKWLLKMQLKSVPPMTGPT